MSSLTDAFLAIGANLGIIAFPLGLLSLIPDSPFTDAFVWLGNTAVSFLELGGVDFS